MDMGGTLGVFDDVREGGPPLRPQFGAGLLSGGSRRTSRKGWDCVVNDIMLQ